MKSFDFIAPVYDSIKYAVFGNKLNAAEEYRLSSVTKTDRVLVFGGGSGKVLMHPFFKKVPNEVLFVDASVRMLRKAQDRAKKNGLSNIHFLCGTEKDLTDGTYDLVLCPFILDVFTEEELPVVVELLIDRLAEGGQLVVTDFTKGVSKTNNWFVPLMYLFFRLVGALSNKDVAGIEKVLLERLKMRDRKYFLDGKVASWVFEKP